MREEEQYKTEGPSLRSEFGSVGIPGDGNFRFGGREPVKGSAKTYAFSRFEKPREDPQDTPKPEAEQDISVQPVTPQSVSVQTVWPLGTEFQIPPIQPAQPADPAPQVSAPAPVQPERNGASASEKAGPWVAAAVIAALLLGIVIGAFGYQLWSDWRENRPDPGRTDPSGTGTYAETGGDTAPDATMSPAEIYEAWCPSVVGVTAFYETEQASSFYKAPAAGTGFLISEDGYILTNRHVIEDADRVTVTLWDGRELEAELAGLEEEMTTDLALLRIEAEGLQHVRLGDSDAVRVGEQVCTVGNPFGELGYSLTVGYVSALDRQITSGTATFRVLQTDVAINSGSSGGPLFDSAGRVIGIITAKYSGSADPNAAAVEGLGFAIPINDAAALASAWMAADGSSGANGTR